MIERTTEDLDEMAKGYMLSPTNKPDRASTNTDKARNGFEEANLNAPKTPPPRGLSRGESSSMGGSLLSRASEHTLRSMEVDLGKILCMVMLCRVNGPFL